MNNIFARYLVQGLLWLAVGGCVRGPASPGQAVTPSAPLAALVAVAATPMLATPPVWAGMLGEADVLAIGRGWQASHEAYQPDAAAMTRLRAALAAQPGLRLLTIFGAWCGDSMRHVPELVKVQAALGQDALSAQYVGVNRHKTQPPGVTDRYRIRKFPTFLVLRGDVEVGRVIEIPRVSIEADLAELVASAKAPSPQAPSRAP